MRKTSAYKSRKHTARTERKHAKRRMDTPGRSSTRPAPQTPITFGAHGKPSIAPKSHETRLFKLEQRDAERRRLDAQYRGIPARAVRMEAYSLKHKPVAAGMEKAA